MRRIAALCLLLAMAACGGTESSAPTSPPSSTPSTGSALNEQERVVEALMRALEAGDCSAVKLVVVTPSAIDCAQVTEASGMLIAEGVDLGSVSYEAGEIAGDSSTVTITWSKDLPPELIDIQRVDGTWLVVFDSAP